MMSFVDRMATSVRHERPPGNPAHPTKTYRYLPIVSHQPAEPPKRRHAPPVRWTPTTPPNGQKETGKKRRVAPPPRVAGYATSIASARSQSPLLSRTSSRIEVMRRERTSRPVGDRRLRPRTTLSWMRLKTLQRSSPEIIYTAAGRRLRRRQLPINRKKRLSLLRGTSRRTSRIAIPALTCTPRAQHGGICMSLSDTSAALGPDGHGTRTSCVTTHPIQTGSAQWDLFL